MYKSDEQRLTEWLTEIWKEANDIHFGVADMAKALHAKMGEEGFVLYQP